MTMKLPLILSAMLAAFAISGTNASEPTTDEAAATTEAAPAEAAAPEAAETAKPAAKKKGKRHHRKHRHHGGGGGGHMADKWDQPWDYIQQGGDSSGCSGDSSDDSPRMPVPEVPGQKTP